MRSARRVLLRTLAIAAFICLSIGGPVRFSSADGGMYDGGYQNGTGAGAGASGEPGANPCYGCGSSTGSGTGGSTETGGTSGSGAGGTTSNDNSGNSSNISNKSIRGTTEGGVFYPDNSNVLGPSGSDYEDK